MLCINQSICNSARVLISDKVIEEEEREVFEMQHNTLDEQLFLR